MIKRCLGTNCKNEFQDKMYNGLRVMNELKEKGWRCTVCTTVIAKNPDAKKK